MFYKFWLCLILMVLGTVLVVNFEPDPCQSVNEWFTVGFMLLGASTVLTMQFVWKNLK